MIIEFLTELGFKKYDLALLIFCPAGAVIGSLAQSILVTINPNTPPKNPTKTYRAPSHLAEARSAWLTLRLMLGAILGLVIALYFVGALQENLTTLAKIVALSILLGYSAPKIWVTQERVLINRVSELVNQELRKHEKIEP
ncbi:hypothetical protein ACFQNF_10065 [Iodobacter arcticus]|uniref:Uncharacterized protein n=1 Tax=Iodobacter arcticus TaxID=590593 RepID=A0ABW2QXH9_9NEIS